MFTTFSNGNPAKEEEEGEEEEALTTTTTDVYLRTCPHKHNGALFLCSRK